VLPPPSLGHRSLISSSTLLATLLTSLLHQRRVLEPSFGGGDFLLHCQDRRQGRFRRAADRRPTRRLAPAVRSCRQSKDGHGRTDQCCAREETLANSEPSSASSMLSLGLPRSSNPVQAMRRREFLLKQRAI
jgi:hypothetical protein